MRRIEQWCTGLTLLAAIALVVGCDKLKPAPAAQGNAGGPPKTPTVLVELPTTGEIVDYEDFTGRTVSSKTIDVRARVTGYLQKINFKDHEGGNVERGSVLFEIDPRPYQAEVARTEATHAQAQAHMKRIELDYERAKKTVANKVITSEQFDQVAGDRAEALAAIEVAKANVDLAKLNLAYTKVVAPISGRVGRTMLDAGNLVRADDTILTTIVTVDPIYAYFEIDERTLLRLRRYMEEGRIKAENDQGVTVMMGLADEDGYPHKGAINFFDNRLDSSTGTLQLRGVFHNKDGMLAPGLFIRVRLPVGEPYQALLVSEQSLGTDQGQKFVYVIDKENKARYRVVQVGKLQHGQRVILKGLEADERIVVSGLQRVRPNVVVEPKLAEATAREATASQSVESGTVAEAATAEKTSPKGTN